MNNTIKYEWDHISQKSKDVVKKIQKYFKINPRSFHKKLKVYGIPRGGIFAAQNICIVNDSFKMCDVPEEADLFIDDIIDTGTTAKKYQTKYNKPVFALIDKTETTNDFWYIFPWEKAVSETGPTENIRRLLEYIGEDPNREGLKETPERVIRSYETIYGGYRQKPEDVLKVFEDGACDEIVLLKNIEFYSTCEHHMIPFIGKAHIAYCPNNKVIGISKLARLLEIYTRRLQIQERIGAQVTQALDMLLDPKGSACVLEAQHLCMTSRGVQKQNSIMVTSSLTGVFKTEHDTRNELLTLIKG